jgi:methylated-DNA-protein-cysteine methyltransferase related protein
MWVPRFLAPIGEKLGAGHLIKAAPPYAAAVASDRERQILARVRAIPVGFVRTYGDVSPGAPRVAGAVLHGCDDPRLPWHRVVRADGTLAKGERQRSLLDAEGVPFRGSRVDLRVARLPEA